MPEGVAVVDAPGLDRQGRPTRRAPCAPTRSPRSCAPSPRSPTGEADALVSRRLDRRRAGRLAVRLQARPRRPPPGAGDPRPGPRRARSCCSTRAPTSRCGPSTSSSSRTWARRSWRPCGGVALAARGAALQRHGGRRRAPRTSSPRTRARRRRRGPELRRQRRGLRDRHRRGRRDRRRRLHRQRRAEGDGGLSAALLGAVRAAAMSSPRSKARRPAAAARAARAARRARPRGAGRRGAARPAASWASSRTARSARAGFARAIEVAARGVREDVAGRTHERLAAAGALRRAPVRGAPASVPEQS